MSADREVLAHTRAWAGHGEDRGQDAGAYCIACSDAAQDYVWPCVGEGR